MKMAEIQVDGVYRVAAAYRRQAKARVLATRVEYDKEYGPLSRRMRSDGVRVVLEEAVESSLRFENHAAGDEIVVPSRKVIADWDQDDQERLEAFAAERDRQRREAELLGRAGYATDGYDREKDDFVEGDFRWRGEWLEVRGELRDRLMELIADDAGVSADA